MKKQADNLLSLVLLVGFFPVNAAMLFSGSVQTVLSESS